ncbi:16S rRNA (cytosine(967)-C(5))-methyltransferase RsmB [Risungbinella massiliensis]|uniref:16S rRNA (cytosine(967)-C(5))-methyltransferase RsmB n=1 Tax=Risungbinella massiliensis TaxID=1329796 RepID=UPI000AD786EF|nr:16S rRNA (cytosine(967)-C(5))-methyltransferase RsmB [Risungbinella massiliensis]
MKHNQPKGARDWALQILLDLEEKDSYSNLELNRQLQESGLDSRDRGLVTELVYGVIGRKNTLDYLVQRLTKNPNQLAPWVKWLLQIGMYQLLYLDRIPERAAVHETVQIAKERGHKGISGLVNGVLRSFLRQRTALIPAEPKTTVEKAIAYAHPEWMVDRLEEVYGEETARKMMDAQNQSARLSLRINHLRWDRPEWMEEWEETTGTKAIASDISPTGVIVEGVGNPANLQSFADGEFSIQDESSMLVGYALSPDPGSRVLDMCAAPGGKTTHLAELMENQGEIIANDIHPHKQGLIRQQADRLGIEIIRTRVGDARNLRQGFPAESFDAILLDAPCSGLGVIHRKPDIKWRKDSQDVEALVGLQRELLDTAASLLKPGGVLVYSTCTWEPKENSEQISDWLSAHSEMEADESIWDKLPVIVREKALIGDSWVQILPHHFHSDGFFISRLRKKEA